MVDLTTNSGGVADALTYALNTLIGTFFIDLLSPITKGHNRLTYKSDINMEGKVDDKDVPLIDLGYKVIFLNSEYSFSSANALPYLLKHITIMSSPWVKKPLVAHVFSEVHKIL